ncbi:hypothetical protein BU15DRAFT_44816 [Melanogaster broomeanus]|nr:hypothetical protein BU15DRAFT_44816 [Melanogaster broomeanus]
MAGEKSSLRRSSHVYVEIPPSPLHNSRNPYKHSPHVSLTHKENALLRSSSSQMISSTISAPSPPKRKLDVDSIVGMSDQPLTKKPKAAPSNPTDVGQVKKLANATDEYPNGFVYCHQCNKKRDVAASVHCTMKDHKDRRCGTKYCKPCLKNRYGLALEDILAEGETEDTMSHEHVHGEGYHFKCPRCDDICNCVTCRKAKGLRPTGSRGNRTTSKSLSVLVKGKTKPQPNAKIQQTAQSINNAKLQVGVKPRWQAKAKPLPKPKPIWTSVDTALSLSEAEERINIREFSLRFSSVMELSRTHLDELEELRPSRTRNIEDEDDGLVPWVSEACAKSLILGLLSLLDASGHCGKYLTTTIKAIRDSGAHLNKIWASLATLRDWQENDLKSSRPMSTTFLLSFPDPIPAPESATMIRTRSGAKQSHIGSINVLRTAQLIPVISALVNAAVESEAVRQELDAGVQEAKERTREAREAHRIENERFEQEKEREKAKEKKSRIEYHRRVVTDIDDTLKVSLCAYTTRISPLGRDMEGRVYWVLTPGMNEREAVLDRLQSYSQGCTRKSSRARRKPLVPSEEDRSALKKWSWFIAVWGKRPPVTERTIDTVADPDDSEAEESDEGEQWWGFWDPVEITRLVSWIQAKARLEDTPENVHGASIASKSRSQFPDSDIDMDDLTDSEDSDDGMQDINTEISATPTKVEVRSLVNELEQYATLLKCRIRRDEEIEDAGSSLK